MVSTHLIITIFDIISFSLVRDDDVYNIMVLFIYLQMSLQQNKYKGCQLVHIVELLSQLVKLLP